jgi:hypothetical protein
LAGPDDRDERLAPVGGQRGDLDAPRLHEIQVAAGVALAEDHLPAVEGVPHEGAGQRVAVALGERLEKRNPPDQFFTVDHSGS